MNLRFLLGRAGTGKTHYILEHIKNTVKNEPIGPPVILLVPEQATFQAEYDLAVKTGLGGSIRAQVLSFRRLAYRVLLETGGAGRIPIGELGKRMVLRGLLARHEGDLRVFHMSTGRSGFTDQLVRSIGEMKTYRVTPDDLDQAIGSVTNASGALLRDKLIDLALLYREMDDFLAQRYTDPDGYLTLLSEKIANADSFRNAQIWIDGFKGFTPQELAVIEKLLQICRNVNVALCMDPELKDMTLNEHHVFFPTWETKSKLLQLVKPGSCEDDGEQYIVFQKGHRFKTALDLCHLEKKFFTTGTCKYSDSPENIRLVAGSNKRAEVEACAREIVSQARELGYRWLDISVMLRGLEPYKEIISTVFRDYDIPFFIDSKENVLHHPLVELIRSALETISKNWSYQPLFRYLKTDLVPISREEVYKLENYVLAHGIRGQKWVDDEDWAYQRNYTIGEDREIKDEEKVLLAELNLSRRAAVRALDQFACKMAVASSVKQMTADLFALLTELRVPETIEKWRQEAEETGWLAKAREHAQIWPEVIALFDEVVEALGSEEVSIQTYLGILEAGFESMSIGMIPPSLDQVVVGSLDRSRNPDVKSVFVLGISEGSFPARISDDGFFSDSERNKLTSLGISLASGSRRRAFDEQYLVYTALTRASEKLWLSYPMADDEGRAMAPSSVINRVKDLFPQLAEITLQVDPVSGFDSQNLGFIVNRGRTLGYLVSQLRDAKNGKMIESTWWEIYNWFLRENSGDKETLILQSVFYSNIAGTVAKPTGLAMYGSPVKASVSRMEKFMACPFAHFTSYGLRLKERKAYRLEAPDMGEFFHAALKKFADTVSERSLNWGALTRDECAVLTNEIIECLAPQLQSEILLSTARYRYLTGKLQKTVNRAVIMLGEHARRSVFKPVGLEMGFGRGGALPPVIVDLAHNQSLELAGRIDRLDLAEGDEGVYLRVIDYKSRDQALAIPDIFFGLRLQLLIYLHAAIEYYSKRLGTTVKPGGVLYFTVKEPLITSLSPMSIEAAEKAVQSKLKMKGLILADPGVLAMMDNQVSTGWSDLFPVGIKRDGSFYTNSPVIREQQFDLLREHVINTFRAAGEKILEGNVDILPYRSKLTTACQFCKFKPVCKFDSLLDENNFRVLPHLAVEKVWQLMERKGE